MESVWTIAQLLDISTLSDVKHACGPVSTATNVWGGNQLSLAALEPLRGKLLQKTIIGLGSGLGILEIVGAALGAHTIATDLADVLPLLERNIAQNARVIEGHKDGGCRAAALDWRQPPPADIRHAGPFDYIFASDVVYWPELFQPLVDTLCRLSDLSSGHGACGTDEPAILHGLVQTTARPPPHVFLAMEARKSSELHFFSLLDSHGFRWYRVDDVYAGHDGLARSSGQSVGLFWCQRVAQGTNIPRGPSAAPANAEAGASSPVIDRSPLHPEVEAAAQCIWGYHVMSTPLARADIILALGSNDPRVAVYAAQLWLRGLGPLLMFSGGVGVLTEGLYGGLSEAQYFANIATAMGVPQDAILVEGRSTNTGENIRFSSDVLLSSGRAKDDGLWPRRLLLVQKPFMERRSLATFEAQGKGQGVWKGLSGPGGRVAVTSPPIPWAKYPLVGRPGLDKRGVLSVMAGDLQRIATYPAKGFQSRQDIPRSVWQALQVLVQHGYSGHLVKAAPSGGPQTGGTAGAGAAAGQGQPTVIFNGLDPNGPEPDCIIDG